MENRWLQQDLFHEKQHVFHIKTASPEKQRRLSSNRRSGSVDMWISSPWSCSGCIRAEKIFSLLHKNQKSFFFTGRIALGWSIDSPSRSQRYSCRVRFLTWEEFLGHWKRPLSSLLYRRQKPSFSKCSALIRSQRLPQKRNRELL